MAERKFYVTADDLREATAISLGFDAASDTVSSSARGTSARTHPDDASLTGWRGPDAGALDAARVRLSTFSARIISDEQADGSS
jgi:hypothetical protein